MVILPFENKSEIKLKHVLLLTMEDYINYQPITVNHSTEYINNNHSLSTIQENVEYSNHSLSTIFPQRNKEGSTTSSQPWRGEHAGRKGEVEEVKKERITALKLGTVWSEGRDTSRLRQVSKGPRYTLYRVAYSSWVRNAHGIPRNSTTEHTPELSEEKKNNKKKRRDYGWDPRAFPSEMNHKT
jgi:hypothetical protein